MGQRVPTETPWEIGANLKDRLREEPQEQSGEKKEEANVKRLP